VFHPLPGVQVRKLVRLLNKVPAKQRDQHILLFKLAGSLPMAAEVESAIEDLREWECRAAAHRFADL
jgi:hypothetical protein